MILQESLASIKIEDALKYGGNKGPVRADWAGKYVNQLDKKVAGAIIVSAIQYQTGETVKKVLSSRQERISKGLEELVKEPEKTEPGK